MNQIGQLAVTAALPNADIKSFRIKIKFVEQAFGNFCIEFGDALTLSLTSRDGSQCQRELLMRN